MFILDKNGRGKWYGEEVKSIVEDAKNITYMEGNFSLINDFLANKIGHLP